MTVSEVRERYLAFFAARGHSVIPSAPIVPENDPTTLFISSGMQPLVPYLLGEAHPKGARLVNSQMCFRAEDIEEVGDNRHTTFFEMLGNWSLGDYFKSEQISWIFEFLTSTEEGLGLDPRKLFVTVFSGDDDTKIEADTESVGLWKTLFADKGVDAKFVELGTKESGADRGMQGGHIFSYNASKNWWSRSGVPSKMPAGEPGGPDSEIFYDFGSEHDTSFGAKCHPNCDCGRFVEIGNSVFMQYIKKGGDIFAELPKKNVDFGGGLERLAAATRDNPDIFLTDVFGTACAVLAERTGKEYKDSAVTNSFRIILDHMRAASFMLASGITPSNTEQGYVLRRLIRRAIREVDKLGIKDAVLAEVAEGYGKAYTESYPFVHAAAERIHEELNKEETKFRKTLAQGLHTFGKKISNDANGTAGITTTTQTSTQTSTGTLRIQHATTEVAYNTKSTQTSTCMAYITKLAGESRVINKDTAFTLFTSHGFPIEMIEELAKEKGMTVDRSGFDALMKEHQEKSRAGAAQKFKGGLADASEETTMLHTATHLMLAGLRKYLGDSVHQAGSNITAERARFDFTYSEKVPRETLDKVEAFVNEAIEKGCVVTIEQITKDAARESGVEASFWEKYPDIVNVYTIKSADGIIYSQEICGGPHIENTGVIRLAGKHFKIIKEESSSAGVRRVKAVLE